jgi:hypothetical protein
VRCHVAWFRCKGGSCLLSGGRPDSICFEMDICLFRAHFLEIVESCTSKSQSLIDYQ